MSTAKAAICSPPQGVLADDPCSTGWASRTDCAELTGEMELASWRAWSVVKVAPDFHAGNRGHDATHRRRAPKSYDSDTIPATLASYRRPVRNAADGQGNLQKIPMSEKRIFAVEKSSPDASLIRRNRERSPNAKSSADRIPQQDGTPVQCLIKLNPTTPRVDFGNSDSDSTEELTLQQQTLAACPKSLPGFRTRHVLRVRKNPVVARDKNLRISAPRKVILSPSRRS